FWGSFPPIAPRLGPPLSPRPRGFAAWARLWPPPFSRVLRTLASVGSCLDSRRFAREGAKREGHSLARPRCRLPCGPTSLFVSAPSLGRVARDMGGDDTFHIIM